MDAIQTLAQEAAQATAGNNLYETYKRQWRFLLESYVGGIEYRRAQHLTKYQLETESEYNARLLTTPLDNHCRSVVSVYNSFLFRENPKRDLGQLEQLPQIQDLLRDSDFEGRSLDNFMKEVSTWSSVFGHCWVMVSKPNVGAMTLADEQAMGVRPYLSLLTPMVVLDWSFRRLPSGRYDLDYLKYVEDVNGDVETVREWWPNRIVTRVVDTKEQIIRETIEEVNELGVIPAVISYAARNTVRGIGVSDIADIADVQKFIYNATSEIDQSIRLDSHPSLVKTPETQAGIGAGSIIHMPENLDPGLKPYVLEFSGASVDKIINTIDHSIASIDKMANIGAVRATEAKTMSGVAMETEFQLLNARLAEKADNLELAEEQIWKLICAYMGYTWDGVIDYPGSFNIRDTGSEIQQLKTARETATDPRVWAEIDQRIIDWLGVDLIDEEPMLHAMTMPGEDRIEHIQEMVMSGLTDQQILDLHPEINQSDIDQAKQQLLNQGE